MDGQKAWAEFAKKNGITWEEGPRARFDQHRAEYEVYIFPQGDPARLLQYLRIGHVKHVIIRTFPQVQQGLVRIRFSAYPEKPA